MSGFLVVRHGIGRGEGLQGGLRGKSSEKRVKFIRRHRTDRGTRRVVIGEFGRVRRAKRKRRMPEARRIKRHGERGSSFPQESSGNCLIGGRCVWVLLGITEIDQSDRIEKTEVEQE